MLYLLNEMRFLIFFFTFEYVSTYSFEIIHLFGNQVKINFLRHLHDVIFSPKTLILEHTHKKTYDCWDFCKVWASSD